MKLEEFISKLATIQADEHLTIEKTIDIKQKIVGSKRLWDCSSSELEDIMQEYRKEYIKNQTEKVVTYNSSYKYKKSKNKYSARKDWD